MVEHGAPLVIRPPRLAECAALTELCLRSKAHWGYSDEFMAACRQELTLLPQRLQAEPTWVAERGGSVVGILSLDLSATSEAEVGLCFVAPEAIGSGVGRALWQEAIAMLRKRGISTLRIESDPHAEGFYLSMGAIRIGSVPSSSISGRMLPLLQFALGLHET